MTTTAVYLADVMADVTVTVRDSDPWVWMPLPEWGKACFYCGAVKGRKGEHKIGCVWLRIQMFDEAVHEYEGG